MPVTAIVVEEVGKRFGRGAASVEALRRVDLSVAKGEVFGLLGRNGAGKTTLVKILLDMVRPTTGRTSLLGMSSREPAARRRVGYLPEDHRFPDYQTARSALLFHGALAGLDRATVRKRADELLETMDLTAARDRKVRGFSKGMKQRLGLAQALIHEPEVVFLDEPTDGVDPVGRARIRDMLVALREKGTTIFLNSHLLSEVEQLCNRVGILERGELVRVGTIDQLTRTELVYRVDVVPRRYRQRWRRSARSRCRSTTSATASSRSGSPPTPTSTGWSMHSAPATAASAT